jgi:3,4-dihydroxy 2-butanone 4-phosphate synthase/GTP cyclohydrolase II
VLDNYQRVEAVLAAFAKGEIVVVTDDDDRENEGDLFVAASLCTPEKMAFIIRNTSGIVCAPLSADEAKRLHLDPMVAANDAPLGTAFTVSVDVRHGLTTGISAEERTNTVRALANGNSGASDFVRPGHVFPLVAKDGGVLVRAGHTEAAVDLARLAGLYPAGVICEIMNDDGTMARLPDLVHFAAQHGLKIGTIADLIEYRSRNESLVQRAFERDITTPWGDFHLVSYRDLALGAIHLALVLGKPQPQQETLVRVHEPLSIVDLLDAGHGTHSWGVGEALQAIRQAGTGVMVLLNCTQTSEALEARLTETRTPRRGMDLRLYGIGAQILRDIGVGRMRLLAAPRKMPSMTGFGLEVTGYAELPRR